MKEVRNQLHEYGYKVHTHVKKHYKKYLFWLVSAALVCKVIPVLIAWIFMTKNFSFASLLEWVNYETCTQEQKEWAECTNEVNPVCWDDGIAYDNACAACLVTDKYFVWLCHEQENSTQENNTQENSQDENNEDNSEDLVKDTQIILQNTPEENETENDNQSENNVLPQNAESLDEEDESDNVCGAEDILFLAPLSGSIYGWDISIKWNLKNEDCSGQIFTIKLWDANVQYVSLWTWLAESWAIDFDSTQLFSGFYSQTWLDESWNVVTIYTGLYTWVNTYYFTWHKIVIYLWEEWDDNWLEPLYEWDLFTIDNQAPSITWVNISFTWANRSVSWLVWLNDSVELSFTASEELTGTEIVILWKNATLQSVSWLVYTYKMNFSEANTSWKFIYNITCRDLAWNESYYEWYNENMIFDKDKPTLQRPLQFSNTWDMIRYRIALVETWSFEFVYQWSGETKEFTITWWNDKNFRWIFSWIDPKMLYNYRLTVKDLAWNESNFEWYFQVSWDTVDSTTNMISDSGLVEVWFVTVVEQTNTGTSIIQWLKQQISNYNLCKSWITDFRIIDLPIKNYVVKLEMPDFEKSAIQKLVSSFAIVLYEKISDSNMTESDVKALTNDFNEFLVVLKLVRDDEWSCKQNLSNYYMSKFRNGLSKYNLTQEDK